MSWYWNHSRFLEIDKLTAILFAVSIVACSEFGVIDHLRFQRDLIIATAGLAGSLLGFMIAALAVMVALLDEEGVALLKSSGHVDTILLVYNSTLSYLGIFTLVLLMTSALTLGPISNPYYAGMFLALTFICSFRIQKSVWFLVKILNVLRR